MMMAASSMASKPMTDAKAGPNHRGGLYSSTGSEDAGSSDESAPSADEPSAASSGAQPNPDELPAVENTATAVGTSQNQSHPMPKAFQIAKGASNQTPPAQRPRS